MADNVAITAGTGTSIAADEVVDGTLGTVKVQYVKIMDATLDGTSKAAVGANGLKVDPSGATSPVSVASGQIVDAAIATLGAKADAKNTATDTTSVSAMSVLKQISASVQAPPSQAVTNAGTFAVQATLAASSGTDIGKLTANQSVNMAQVAGTTTDTNSGVKSAGTIRVVLATDQPALTNKLLVTPDSVALPANQSVNVSQINGVTALMGNGVTGTGSQRVTIASDNTAFSVNAVQSGTYTVQPGNTPNSTPWLVANSPATSGGCLMSKLVSAASTNATSLKASAGQLYMVTASNINASARYLKFYNKASSPTVGTDTPVLTFLIPGNASGAGTNIPVPDTGLAFGTGIAYAITTGATDADTGAVAANDIIVNIAYK